MNDRYLYRAKRTDNGEWVEGFYVNAIEEHGNGERIAEIVALDAILTFDGISPTLMVDPSTICQCTGLKDKNGKLIWENDVVELYDRNTDYKWRAVVLFGNPNCEYTWGWQLKPIVECEANTDILCWIDMEESGAFCGVIGSAIDNPELLEVGE